MENSEMWGKPPVTDEEVLVIRETIANVIVLCDPEEVNRNMAEIMYRIIACRGEKDPLSYETQDVVRETIKEYLRGAKRVDAERVADELVVKVVSLI